uniref:Uncharacterized protein n=1 Tax=Glossina pallidipes TaxID=7398 RepID=A0A1A9ZPE5_GLOPL
MCGVYRDAGIGVEEAEIVVLCVFLMVLRATVWLFINSNTLRNNMKTYSSVLSYRLLINKSNEDRDILVSSVTTTNTLVATTTLLRVISAYFGTTRFDFATLQPKSQHL